ncbi:MAG TPA: hypothetical protein VGG82_07895 [Casimicrobiaceae bacterium]
MTRAFYDLRSDVTTDPAELAQLQLDAEIDRHRRIIERQHKRGDEQSLRRWLVRLHAIDSRGA